MFARTTLLLIFAVFHYSQATGGVFQLSSDLQNLVQPLLAVRSQAALAAYKGSIEALLDRLLKVISKEIVKAQFDPATVPQYNVPTPPEKNEVLQVNEGPLVNGSALYRSGKPNITLIGDGLKVDTPLKFQNFFYNSDMFYVPTPQDILPPSNKFNVTNSNVAARLVLKINSSGNTIKLENFSIQNKGDYDLKSEKPIDEDGNPNGPQRQCVIKISQHKLIKVLNNAYSIIISTASGIL